MSPATLTLHKIDKGLSMKKLHYLFFSLFACNCFGQDREIAITIDDLPLVASKMNTAGNQQRSTERFKRSVKIKFLRLVL